jgi:hypothetical protein
VLAVIPRNPTQCRVPKKLESSSTINRNSYLSNPASSCKVSISEVSSTSFSSNIDQLEEKKKSNPLMNCKTWVLVFSF